MDREESEYKWMGEWEVPAQLQHLSEEKLLFLARRFKPCQFKNGEMVFRVGDPGRSMFFVNSGSVAVTVNDVVVDRFHTRDFFNKKKSETCVPILLVRLPSVLLLCLVQVWCLWIHSDFIGESLNESLIHSATIIYQRVVASVTLSCKIHTISLTQSGVISGFDDVRKIGLVH